MSPTIDLSRYEDDRFDDYDDYGSTSGSKGGGGGSKKRSPNSETSKAARSAHIEQAQGNRKQEAINRLVSFATKFPKFRNEAEEKEFAEVYLSWVQTNFDESWNEFDISESEVEVTFTKSGKKAGGQNVNKVNSQANILHLITNYRVKNDETRDQLKNLTKAQYLLKESLWDHLEQWRIVEKKKEAITLESVTSLIKAVQENR
jgi:protein subunit release factor B